MLMKMFGQGATEYLVLLAVVLIVALVSVALLGFFPGMASDSQRQQSEMYWKSASPIAITEWAARVSGPSAVTYPYMMLKNNGAYQIRVTSIVGGDGTKITRFYGAGCGLGSTLYNISDYYYLAPGEEKYLAWNGGYGLTCDREIVFSTGSSSGFTIGGAKSVCEYSMTSPGTVIFPSLGFEYIEYIDGQQITKSQIGKQVIIKCIVPP